jgi:hypothetical protein
MTLSAISRLGLSASVRAMPILQQWPPEIRADHGEVVRDEELG